MAHVVTNKCAKCKFTDCVEVCPVACFYELDNQLVIHPEECIDCQACVAECPVEAIYAEADVPAQFQADIAFNAAQAKQIKAAGKEAILKKKEPLPTAAEQEKGTRLLSRGSAGIFRAGQAGCSWSLDVGAARCLASTGSTLHQIRALRGS